MVTEVKELPGIDEMVEAMNISKLGLIRDVVNLMAKKRKDMIAKIFRI